MAIIASATGGGSTRQLPPEGNHSARCFQIIHTGTHLDEKFGKKKDTLRVSWELPEETVVFKEGDKPKPFVVNKKYTLSLGDKSTLRKDLQSWRGRAFTDDELKGFDVSNLLNAPCMLQIIHNKVDDTVYANISSISSTPKGLVVPNLFNDTLLFDVNAFDKDVFDILPEFIQKEIMESDEYRQKPVTTDGTGQPQENDSLPF